MILSKVQFTFVFAHKYTSALQHRSVNVYLVMGCVFTATIVSLNIPEGVLFTDFVKRLKNDGCFHELN